MGLGDIEFCFFFFPTPPQHFVPSLSKPSGRSSQFRLESVSLFFKSNVSDFLSSSSAFPLFVNSRHLINFPCFVVFIELDFITSYRGFVGCQVFTSSTCPLLIESLKRSRGCSLVWRCCFCCWGGCGRCFCCCFCCCRCCCGCCYLCGHHKATGSRMEEPARRFSRFLGGLSTDQGICSPRLTLPWLTFSKLPATTRNSRVFWDLTCSTCLDLVFTAFNGVFRVLGDHYDVSVLFRPFLLTEEHLGY